MIRKKNILRYIFSLVLSLVFISGYSQEEDTTKTEKPIKNTAFDGIRISYDIWNFADVYIRPSKFEQEFHVDFFIRPRALLTGNFGRTWVDRELNDFKYEARGSFIKAGIAYNAFTEHENILSVGAKIGSATFTHRAWDITIPVADSVWNDVTDASVQEERMNATWLEITLGMKVEVFANFYLGWGIQGKLMLLGPKNNQMTPFEIPGYGSGNKNTGVGFNYYLSYQIPIKF